MNCPHCNNIIKDTAKFCPYCGKAVLQKDTAVPQPKIPLNTTSEPQTKLDTQVEQSKATSEQSNQNESLQPINNTHNSPTKSLLGMAYSDLKNSNSWSKKVILLFLINQLPIFNFASSGYMAEYGASINGSQLDQELTLKKLTHKSFITGIAQIIASIFTYSAIGLSYLFFIKFPIVGFFAWLAYVIFVISFVQIAFMRGIITRRFRSSFDISEIFNVYRNHLKEALSVTLVPELIRGIIGLVIFATALLITIAVAAATFSSFESSTNLINSIGNLGQYGSSNSPINSLLAIITMLTTFISTVGLTFSVAFLINNFIGTFINLWEYRAVGRFIDRFANHWTNKDIS